MLLVIADYNSNNPLMKNNQKNQTKHKTHVLQDIQELLRHEEPPGLKQINQVFMAAFPWGGVSVDS